MPRTVQGLREINVQTGMVTNADARVCALLFFCWFSGYVLTEEAHDIKKSVTDERGDRRYHELRPKTQLSMKREKLSHSYVFPFVTCISS